MKNNKRVNFGSVAEIREAFIKIGWSSDIEFEEVYENAIKLYRMKGSGNLYSINGEIYRYNVPVINVNC